MTHVTLTTVPNIPLVQEGDDLGSILAKAISDAALTIQDQDVVVVASKIVSKAEGRVVSLDTVTPSPRAQEIARLSSKDPRITELMLRESREILDVKPGVVVVVHRLGFVCTSAGIDRANVAPGTVSLLPDDPDKSAVLIRRTLMQAFGKTVAVVINDSFGIEFRAGSIGLAIGVAGLPAVLRGGPEEMDLYEKKRNVAILFADEVAAAASLLMGQSAAACPVVVVSGLHYTLTTDSQISDVVVAEQIEAAVKAREQGGP